MSERIVNITVLEKYIKSAYSLNESLIQELSKTAPDIETAKTISEAVKIQLQNASEFEFCLEQRKVISEVVQFSHQ